MSAAATMPGTSLAPKRTVADVLACSVHATPENDGGRLSLFVPRRPATATSAQLPSLSCVVKDTPVDQERPATSAPREHRRYDTHGASALLSRRPVDEALFCGHRMESEDRVLRKLRIFSPSALTTEFRELCSSLSLHNVRVTEFAFLCAAVLQCSVRPRDCEVIFAFLRAERAPGGGISVAHLLKRLRTLFEPIEVLSALQLKCLLETHRLDHCIVSLDELRRAVLGLCALLTDAEQRGEVYAQWERLGEELERLQVQHAIPVPTIRLLVRRSAHALWTAVRALGWDGIVRINPRQEGEEGEVATRTTLLRAFGVGPLVLCAVDEEDNPREVLDRNAEVLLTAQTLYEQRLDARGRFAFGKVGRLGAASFRRSRQPSGWRGPQAAADPTHPRFIADLYAVLPRSPSRSTRLTV